MTVALAAKNVGMAECRYDGAFAQGSATVIGPCADTSVDIATSNGHVAWPAVACYGGIPPQHILHPGQTVDARDQWDLTGANGKPVLPGTYTVDVASIGRLFASSP